MPCHVIHAVKTITSLGLALMYLVLLLFERLFMPVFVGNSPALHKVKHSVETSTQADSQVWEDSQALDDFANQGEDEGEPDDVPFEEVTPHQDVIVEDPVFHETDLFFDSAHAEPKNEPEIPPTQQDPLLALDSDDETGKGKKTAHKERALT